MKKKHPMLALVAIAMANSTGAMISHRHRIDDFEPLVKDNNRQPTIVTDPPKYVGHIGMVTLPKSELDLQRIAKSQAKRDRKLRKKHYGI